MATYDLTLKIRRYDPQSGRRRWQVYRLQAGGILRFVDLFRLINMEQDATLAWSSSCEHAQCGSCSVRINGRPMLACELLVENAVALFSKRRFVIEPVKVAPVVRDLVVDWEKAYEGVHRAKPYLIEAKGQPAGSLHRILPEELSRYKEATRCINCFCCADACLSGRRTFIGPNAALACVVRAMDSREIKKEERLSLLYSDDGIYRCHSSKACSHVCPKGIDVAGFLALAKSGLFQEGKGSRERSAVRPLP